VTTRLHNLYSELLDVLGCSAAVSTPEPSQLYTAACRTTKSGDEWLLQTWLHPLTVGRPLPVVPLWLADDLALPLDLAESYDQSCAILNIP